MTATWQSWQRWLGLGYRIKGPLLPNFNSPPIHSTSTILLLEQKASLYGSSDGKLQDGKFTFVGELVSKEKQAQSWQYKKCCRHGHWWKCESTETSLLPTEAVIFSYPQGTQVWCPRDGKTFIQVVKLLLDVGHQNLKSAKYSELDKYFVHINMLIELFVLNEYQNNILLIFIDSHTIKLLRLKMIMCCLSRAQSHWLAVNIVYHLYTTTRLRLFVSIQPTVC